MLYILLLLVSSFSNKHWSALRPVCTIIAVIFAVNLLKKELGQKPIVYTAVDGGINPTTLPTVVLFLVNKRVLLEPFLTKKREFFFINYACQIASLNGKTSKQ